MNDEIKKADEIVRALRTNDLWPQVIVEGKEVDANRAAADLIESLQADHESYQQVKKALQREGYSDIETMISQYKQVMIAANEHDLDRGEEVERLEAQLAASQRREKAAVEFIKYLDRNYSGYMTEDERFEQWRGPQAGKGE